MKLGFGLNRHMLDQEHYQFARQCGATHFEILKKLIRDVGRAGIPVTSWGPFYPWPRKQAPRTVMTGGPGRFQG